MNSGAKNGGVSCRRFSAIYEKPEGDVQTPPARRGLRVTEPNDFREGRGCREEERKRVEPLLAGFSPALTLSVHRYLQERLYIHTYILTRHRLGYFRTHDHWGGVGSAPPPLLSREPMVVSSPAKRCSKALHDIFPKRS